MYHIKLCERWTGLCNQLFALVNGILVAQKDGFKKVSIGPFSPSLRSKQRIPITKVINLAKTGKNIGMSLTPGGEKGHPSFAWYTRFDEDQFCKILHCLVFEETFYKIVDEVFEDNFRGDEPLNVAHLRIERDAIRHWSKMNRLTEDKFERLLHARYLEAVTGNIKKGEKILVLTYDTKNTVIKKLERDYRIVYFNWESIVKERFGVGGRELCAILDLLLGIRCTGTFIGCHNWKKKRGSTFSYVLRRLMEKAKKGVFLDLDDIRQELAYN